MRILKMLSWIEMKTSMWPKYFFLLFLSSLLLFGCASKRFGKKAKEFDSAGLYVDAARMYYESVLANGNNIESKLGLQRNGQLVLAEKLELFKTQYNNNAYKDAVYAFLDAENYAKKVNDVGIKLIFPAENQVYFAEMKEHYLSARYQDAMQALDLEQFSGAELILAEVLSIDVAYKDAKQHWITAKYEPIYRNGIQYAENHLYRLAYYSFSEVMAGSPTYRDVVTRKADALQLATITIAVAPFVMPNQMEGPLSQAFQSKAIAALNNLDSPFFKVVIDNGVNSLVGSRLSSQKSVVSNYIRQYSQLIKAKAVLLCRILKNVETTGVVIKNTKPGYLKREEEYVDSEGLKKKRVVYDKVQYHEHQQNNLAELQAEFSLIDVATGNVVVSDVVGMSLNSNVSYATYQGDIKNLVPGYWKTIDKFSAEDKVYDTSEKVSALQALLKSNRTIVSASSLMTDVVARAAAQLALTVEKYNPEV